jgi:2'-5' RNA ligase
MWSGIHGDVDRLANLQSDLDRQLSGIGFVPEKRAFRGHLTLGRVKGRIQAGVLARAISACGSFNSPAWTVERLVLFKSDLKPSGAVYTELFEGNLTSE